jgi:hypothetical protein
VRSWTTISSSEEDSPESCDSCPSLRHEELVLDDGRQALGEREVLVDRDPLAVQLLLPEERLDITVAVRDVEHEHVSLLNAVQDDVLAHGEAA